MTATISISMIAFAVVVAAVEEWRAPARAAVKRNPVLADAASNKRGKAVYVSQCASCHGDSGSDLTNLRRQSDGELFGKSPKAGTKCHPSLSERQRWDVVNYLRTLGK